MEVLFEMVGFGIPETGLVDGAGDFGKRYSPLTPLGVVLEQIHNGDKGQNEKVKLPQEFPFQMLVHNIRHIAILGRCRFSSSL